MVQKIPDSIINASLELLQEKLNTLKNAIKCLNESIEKEDMLDISFIRDATILRFEFVIEL